MPELAYWQRNHFEQALLMSHYPRLYSSDRETPIDWTWVSREINHGIDNRYLRHNRYTTKTVVRNYMSDDREKLVTRWGEDGRKAKWYIESVDKHLSMLNAM